MEATSDRIHTLMEASGLTVKALAEGAAIPRVTLMRRLADPGTFTLVELDRIAEALGVETMALLVGDAA